MRSMTCLRVLPSGETNTVWEGYHGHTGFGVAVLCLVIAMSFDHQHGHVEDSETMGIYTSSDFCRLRHDSPRRLAERCGQNDGRNKRL